METNRIELTFKCPVKWNSMAGSENGRYCSVCEKTVKDFSGSSSSEIAAAASEYECGSFEALQLQRPFGDKRDVLVSYYQKLAGSASPRRISLLFIMLLLFVTGCRSKRLSGAYTWKPAGKAPVKVATRL